MIKLELIGVNIYEYLIGLSRFGLNNKINIYYVIIR